MAPPGQRRGSSSFFDRVKLAMKSEAEQAATAEDAKAESEVVQVTATVDAAAQASGAVSGEAEAEANEALQEEGEVVEGLEGDAEETVDAPASETPVDGDVSADIESLPVDDNEEKEVAGDDSYASVDVAPITPAVPPPSPELTAKPAPTSPRTSARLFGRLLSAMRNELDVPAPEPEKPATIAPSNSPAVSTNEAGDRETPEPLPVDEAKKEVKQTDVASEPDATNADATATKDVVGNREENGEEPQEEVASPVVDMSTAEAEATLSDSEDSSDNSEEVKATPQAAASKPPVSSPQKQSGVFDRFVSAMKSEPTPSEAKRDSVASTRENGNRSSFMSGISALLNDREQESQAHVGLDVAITPEKDAVRQQAAPASNSLFDRLISTVRQETATPEPEIIATAEASHTEITVETDDAPLEEEDKEADTDEKSDVSGEDDDDAKSSLPPEAVAIEELVEKTLDVPEEDTEKAPASETTVTNEMDDVVSVVDHELIQQAIRRLGTALLSVLPLDVVLDIPIQIEEDKEAEGEESKPEDSKTPEETKDKEDKDEKDGRMSTQCFEAIQHMASSGIPMGIKFVAELETRGVLEACAKSDSPQKVSEAQLAELRAAAAVSCSGRLAWTAVPEVLALWSVVHNAVTQGISEEAGESATALEPFDIVQANEDKNVSAETLAHLEVVKEGDDDKAEADNSMYDEQAAQAMLSKALSGLNGPLTVSRAHLADAFQAMREGRTALVGGCLALVNLPPLLRIEIVRDFFQTAGLFLSGLFKPTFRYFDQQQVPEYVSMLVKGLRAAYTIIAIDVSAFIQWVSKASDVGVFCSIGFVMLVHFAFILWLIRITRYMPRGAMDVRHGHEAVTWASLAATNKRMATMSSLIITAALTAYLPLTQLCFSVLDMEAHKDDKNVPEDFNGMVPTDFVKKPYWGLVVLEALLLLFSFSIPLPFLLMWSIRANRPRGSLENADVTYDLDGEEVKFDDKVYARLVSSDPSQLRCPYRSLYNGFEQRWSTYKVMQLIAKSSLAFLIVVSARDVSRGSIVVSVFYGLIVLFTTYSRPFIDPVNDLMETSGKFTALMTALGATGAAWAERNNVESTSLKSFLAFVMFIHFVNMWLMLTVVMLGVGNTRTLIKNWLGWLSFSDTTRMIDDARAVDIVPDWDLNKEAKHRIWQAFWRALLYDIGTVQDDRAKHGELAVKDSPAAARLIALDQAVVTAGIRRVSSHWRGKRQSYTTRLRQVVRTALEGVDVYWDENIGVRDGHLDSKSCFGKMYVVPYPFHVVIVYDNTDDEAIIWDEVDESAPRGSRLHTNLAKLLFLNFSPKITAKRELRQKIRVLAAAAKEDAKKRGKDGPKRGLVRFPFSRVEKAWVKDSVVVKPMEGGRPVTLHHWRLVNFTCHYTMAQFKVKTTGDAVAKGGTKRPMADGFIVTLKYRDGKGIAKAPRTGERVHISGRKAVMDSDHFGLNPDMEENELLKGIFDSARDVWEPGLKKLRAEHNAYRRKLIELHAEANAVLSDDFWYFVYNNQYLSRKDLEQYLKTREVNPQLRNLPTTHATALDALYLRQRFIMMSPAHKFWYIFWDDVYARNHDMAKLIPKGEEKPSRAKKSDFDPCSATSICYKMMKRPALEAWLDERGLRGKASMFHPGLIQLIYDQMEKANAGDPKSVKVRPPGRSFKRRSMIASMVWRPTA